MLMRSIAMTAAALGLATSGLGWGGSARADEISYSADALEDNPAGARRAGRLYVRGSATRYDYLHMGSPVIEIDLPQHGLRRILYPAARTYMEFSAPSESATGKVPCVATTYQTCAKAGSEELGGVATDVWDLGLAGRKGSVRLWWDKSRAMTVREEYPDGRRMHGLKREAEDYEGFKAEQWEFTYLLPGGRYLGGMAVIVPELKTPVVERRPDGTLRRLVNIKTRDIDAAYFDVPQGYRRITLPVQPAPGQTPPSGWQPMTLPPAPQGRGPFAQIGGGIPRMTSSEGDTAAR